MNKTINRTTLSLLLSLTVAGCINPRAPTPREMYRQGSPEEALDKLTVALRTDPSNPDLRAAYLTLREQTLLEWLDQAAKATARADPASAEGYYRRVLRLDAANDVARAGLEALSKETRYRTLLKEAKDLVAAKDTDAAAMKLRTLLAERPDDTAAKDLFAAIEDERSATGEAKLSPALQKRVAIQFKDATVKQIFDVLSAEAGINFVFDKDVKTDAKVNVVLKDITVKEALDTVLTTAQLESSVIGNNSFLIYPNTPAKQKDYKVLVVKAFFLSNANVEEVANTLKLIVKVRDVVIDKSKNLLIIRDTPEAVRISEKLVRLQDLASPEVMIEVEILEVNRTRLSELGINFPGQLTLTPLASTTGGTVTLRDLINITAGTTGATIPPLILNANITDTDIKVLANPRIRAKDRETAKILIGDRVPNITSTATSTGFVSSNVQYIDVGLKLEITPIVSIDNEISMKVALEVSNISSQITTQSGTLAYQIGTRTASTVLRLRDGENQILAGLISNEDRPTANRFPGLSDLPLIGRLFTNQKTDTRKNEIILSITPRILRNTPRQTLAALEFDSGSESKLRNTGLASPAPGVPFTGAAIPPPRPAPGATGPGSPLPGSAPPGSPTAGALTPSTIGQPFPGTTASTTPGGVAGQVATAPSATSSMNGGAPNTVMANLLWLGPSQVKVGDTFQLQLQLGSSQPISAIPYTLSFDPSALEVTGVSEGDLLKQGGGQTTFSQRVDRSTGQISIANARADSGAAKPGTGGTGTLINITVKALSASPGTNVQVISMAPQTGTDTQVNVTLPALYTITIAP